jgi:DUF971 family protein
MNQTQTAPVSRPTHPLRIEPLSPLELFIAWNNGESYSLPYIDARFQCPCAGCVDEHTGKRTLERSSISLQIRAVQVQLVGRYAIQITWSDGHDTGMYHYDRLFELCEKHGRKLA